VKTNHLAGRRKEALKSILLSTLNAKYIHSSLALHYLRAYCQEHSSLRMNIREFTINEALADIMAAIYLEQPEVLCFSCYIWNIRPILEITADYKKLSPRTIIILGGPEVSYDAQTLLQANPSIDFIVRGEGEVSLQELLLALEEDLDVGQVQGISYRQGEKVYHNSDRPLIHDLDSIPFPYPLDLADFRDKIVYYESSRGCPYNCSYCLSSTQQGVRFFPMERVKQDLKVLSTQELREIKFVDRTFNCHEERALEIMRWVIELDTVTQFHFEMEASLLSARMLDFLQTVPAGKFNLEIGIQSTYPPALQAVQRKSDWEKASENITRLKSGHNVHLHLDLIAGLPLETYRDFTRSFNDVYGLQADVLQLGFLKLLKGSAMRDAAPEYGYIYQEQPPYQVLANHYIDYAGMIKLKQIEELLDKYHNSAEFVQSIAYIIRSVFDNDAFGFFEDFARCWQIQGLFDLGHTKESYYKFIIEFIQTHHPDQAEIINDLLKYDYIMNHRTRLPDCLWSYNPSDVNQEIYGYIKDDHFRKLHLADKVAQSPREIRKNMHLEYFRYDPETALYSQKLLKMIFVYDPVKKRVARKIRLA
jgi:radical SAM superfamily enzyme YgiQ (UPF0313 family)